MEDHRFEPLDQLYWRNSELDVSSLDALLDSLQAAPPRPGLQRGPDAVDLQTLLALAREPDVRDAARSRRQVRLLWECCGIPDFRKLADDTHTRLCAKVFGHLASGGTVPTDWIAGQMAGLARADGDIDTLMQRLSGVRVWSYIAARPDWLRDAPQWQARAREVEDLLSDALHERLTARFVDRRAAHLLRRLEQAQPGDELLSAVTARGEVVVEGHPVGHVGGFRFIPDQDTAGEERRLVLRAARRALREEMPRRVSLLEAAPDGTLELLPDHVLAWDGVPVARLRAGPALLHPRVEVLDSEFLDGPQRERIRLRLNRFLCDGIGRDLAPLFAAEAAAAADPLLRGPLHELIEAGGVVPGATDGAIPPALRGRLKALGARAGRFALFIPALLKPRAVARRAQLWALRHGVPVPALPHPGQVAMAPPPDWPPGFAAAMGWVAAGPVLLRLDVTERIAAELNWATRGGPAPVPPDLPSRLAIRADALPAVLHGLGLHLRPGPALTAEEHGPPAPPLMHAARRPARRTRPAQPPVRPDSPFAALAGLRR